MGNPNLKSYNKMPEFIDRVIALLNKTPGRDKCCRYWQYFIRIIQKVVTLLRDKSPDADKPKYDNINTLLESFRQVMGMTRKVLRWGQEFPLIFQFLDLMELHIKLKNDPKFKSEHESNGCSTKESSTAWVLGRMLNIILLFGYYILDHLHFFGSLNLIKDKVLVNAIGIIADSLWLAGSVITPIIHNIEIRMSLRNIQRIKDNKSNHLNEEDKKRDIKEYEKTIILRKIDCLRAIGDIPAAWGLVKAGSMSSNKIGIFGTITSVIGLWQNY